MGVPSQKLSVGIQFFCIIVSKEYKEHSYMQFSEMCTVFKLKLYLKNVLFYLVFSFNLKIIYKSMIYLPNYKYNDTIRSLAPPNLGVGT